MDYAHYDRDALISMIEELKLINEELLQERIQEDQLDFAWTGNLGHWYFIIRTGAVIFNPLKVLALGYTMEELPENVPYSFFTDKLHPDDYQQTMDAMKQHMLGNLPVYECEYRIQAKDGTWKWFYDRGRITRRGPDGKPLFAAGIVFDITEKKEKLHELLKENRLLTIESMTDSLTGIRNRGAIMEELEMRIEKAATYHTPLSIIMLDIDYFKVLNDTYGHAFGDQTLKEIACLIEGETRGLDTLGRYGGEEFLLILPNTNTESACRVAERIRGKVESFVFGQGIQVTISGGVATYGNEELLEFIDKADRRLYEAKNAGRNRIICSQGQSKKSG